MDLGTIIGITVAAVGILLGQVLEGGAVLQILQPTAALIVFGGTIGATMIGFPLETFKRAMVELIYVFKDSEAAPNEVID
jgi:chemotaxis protein MotA